MSQQQAITPPVYTADAKPGVAPGVQWPAGLLDGLRDGPSSFLHDDEESDVASKHDETEGVPELSLKKIHAPRFSTGDLHDDRSLRSDTQDRSLRSDQGHDRSTLSPKAAGLTPTLLSTTLPSTVDALSTSTHANSTSKKGPSGNAPVKTRNVYVAALPLNFTEADLMALLSPYGTVKSCRMFSETDRVAEIGRAYGFALFENSNSAELAVAKLDGTPLGLSRIQVRLSRNGVVKKPKDWRERAKQKQLNTSLSTSSHSLTPSTNMLAQSALSLSFGAQAVQDAQRAQAQAQVAQAFLNASGMGVLPPPPMTAPVVPPQYPGYPGYAAPPMMPGAVPAALNFAPQPPVLAPPYPTAYAPSPATGMHPAMYYGGQPAMPAMPQPPQAPLYYVVVQQ